MTTEEGLSNKLYKWKVLLLKPDYLLKYNNKKKQIAEARLIKPDKFCIFKNI